MKMTDRAGSSTNKDLSRIVGVVMLLIGGILLVMSLFFSGTAVAFGYPAAVTPGRSLFFLAVGLGLSFGGYRVASGAWSGSLQILHWAAAIGGLLFIASTLRLYFFGDPTGLATNRGAAWFCFAISALVVASWIYRSRRSKRRRSSSGKYDISGM